MEYIFWDEKNETHFLKKKETFIKKVLAGVYCVVRSGHGLLCLPQHCKSKNLVFTELLCTVRGLKSIRIVKTMTENNDWKPISSCKRGWGKYFVFLNLKLCNQYCHKIKLSLTLLKSKTILFAFLWHNWASNSKSLFYVKFRCSEKVIKFGQYSTFFWHY